MSDSILVRVTLDSYDLVHPSEKQTQVYVQIPEVARASWLLDETFYAVLKNEPWPHVVDEAHNEYERRGVVSDSTSEAARKAIVDWLLLSEGADYDARFDAVQAAWEADQARQHPVARKLLAQNDELQARVAELETAAYGDATVRLLSPIEQIRHLHSCVAAQLSRANTLDRLCREKRERIAELESERHSTNESLSEAAEALRVQRDRITELEGSLRLLNTQRGDAAQLIERERGEGEECVDIDDLVAALSLGSDETAVKCRCGEPDADPYACEADDCTGEFSELNPFGGGPVQGHDAKVSRTCTECGWKTSVWHVADGSAEEELHGHVTRAHGGTAPEVSR